MLPIIFKSIGIIIIILVLFVFFRSKGKATLERAYHSFQKPIILLSLLGIGIILILLGMVIGNSPRGNESLSSENVVGISTGNDNLNNQQIERNSSTGNYISSNGNIYSYNVSVSENQIKFNGQEINSIEELEDLLKKLDRHYTVLLVDDFAVSPTYHQVENLLSNYGYNIESDE